MHSSNLRGDDFKIVWHGKTVTHADFFSNAQDTDRVGVVIPNRFEGINAITLIMAYVTSFYDRYRERGSDFFAYPDYFTFQRQTPCANYSMIDIWPYHKNVHVPQDAQLTVEAITDRGVTVLLVPDNEVREVLIDPIEMESARRNIKRCFAYTETAITEHSDLVIECHSHLLRDWALAVFDSVQDDDSAEQLRKQFLKLHGHENINQSFREIDLDEALRKI